MEEKIIDIKFVSKIKRHWKWVIQTDADKYYIILSTADISYLPQRYKAVVIENNIFDHRMYVEGGPDCLLMNTDDSVCSVSKENVLEMLMEAI